MAVSCAIPAMARDAHRALSAQRAGELLYVGDTGERSLYVFHWPGKGKPLARIYVGDPSSITLDRENNLYVANLTGHNVEIYGPGGSSPIETVSRGLYNPTGVAVAADGTLYVSDNDGWFNIYEPQTHRLKRTVWLADAGQMGFDRRGYLYVVYQDYGLYPAIMRYPPHSLKGTQLPIDLNSPMAVEPASADIAVSFRCCSYAGIELFAAPSYYNATRCVGGSEFSGQSALYLAFDPVKPYLFASIPPSSGQTAEVAVYSYEFAESGNSCNFVSAIEDDIRAPAGLAVGPDVGQWGKSL